MKIGYIYLIGFISTIFLANWLIGNVGYYCTPCVIPVWPGIMAPSGVLAIGLGFTLRDLVQRHLGVKWTIGAIVVGAGLSAILSPALALASGVAFLASESLDFFCYSRLRQHFWLGAVVVSNTAGAFVDSALFLWLAFGSLNFIAGQVIGKLEMTALFVLMVWSIRILQHKIGISRQILPSDV